MTEKRSYRQYPREFKEEAVASITDQGYSVQKAADSPGIGSNLLYRWQRQQEDQKSGKSLSENEVWAGDITYLRTHEGWMYLAIVMDLYSRRIVGWHIDKRMTSDLIGRALMMAINLRQPRAGLVFHIFGSLKHDWILKVMQPTREHMKLDVAQYIRYFNNDRLHTANGDLSPVKYELSQLKVSGIG